MYLNRMGHAYAADAEAVAATPTTIIEVQSADSDRTADDAVASQPAARSNPALLALLVIVIALMAAGFMRGRSGDGRLKLQGNRRHA